MRTSATHDEDIRVLPPVRPFGHRASGASLCAQARFKLEPGAKDQIHGFARQALAGYGDAPGFRREELEVQTFMQRVAASRAQDR